VLSKKTIWITTLKADNTSNNNVELLGMPETMTGFLNGPWIRKPSTYTAIIFANVGEYASRTVYCEVMINGFYNGLYVFRKKIKQGIRRVDVSPLDNVARLLPEDISPKADKTTGD